MIPDVAGEVITTARIDYGLHLGTADHWQILLAADVEVGGLETPPAEVVVDVAESPLPEEFDGLVASSGT